MTGFASGVLGSIHSERQKLLGYVAAVLKVGDRVHYNIGYSDQFKHYLVENFGKRVGLVFLNGYIVRIINEGGKAIDNFYYPALKNRMLQAIYLVFTLLICLVSGMENGSIISDYFIYFSSFLIILFIWLTIDNSVDVIVAFLINTNGSDSEFSEFESVFYGKDLYNITIKNIYTRTVNICQLIIILFVLNLWLNLHHQNWSIDNFKVIFFIFFINCTALMDEEQYGSMHGIDTLIIWFGRLGLIGLMFEGINNSSFIAVISTLFALYFAFKFHLAMLIKSRLKQVLKSENIVLRTNDDPFILPD